MIGAPVAWPPLAAAVGWAVVCAAVAAAGRWALLFDDPWAPGYDGWYYVLQVRSTQDGEPIFADSSLLYPVLAVAGSLLGDVVLGNKLAAVLFAAVTASSGVILGWRWTGSLAAGAAVGLWWACSPLHLGISAEYLKNAAGVAVLALALALLVDAGRSWSAAAAVVGLLILGFFVHKATAVLGVLTLGAWWAAGGAHARNAGWILVSAVGVGLLAAASWGLLRPADLERLFGPGAPRTAMFTGTLPLVEIIEATWVHLVPVALLVLPAAPPWRAWLAPAWATAAVALVCAAPFLPFGWELTSWRLILLGFLGAGVLAGLLAARLGWAVPAVVGLLGVATLPGSAQDQARREPDYAAWAAHLPTIRAVVPPGGRVIAHRGLCGFVWAEGGRACENFQPPLPHDGWWRIVYGMGAQRLAPYTRTAVPLAPAYTLVPEDDYQRFRSEHAARFRLLSTDLNPWTPRPAYVYGPGGATPAGPPPGTRR